MDQNSGNFIFRPRGEPCRQVTRKSPVALCSFCSIGDCQGWKKLERSCQLIFPPEGFITAPVSPPRDHPASSEMPPVPGSRCPFQGAHPILGKPQGACFFLNLPSADCVSTRGMDRTHLRFWELFRDNEDRADVFVVFTASG